jgi:hypothetical protein
VHQGPPVAGGGDLGPDHVGNPQTGPKLIPPPAGAGGGWRLGRGASKDVERSVTRSGSGCGFGFGNVRSPSEAGGAQNGRNAAPPPLHLARRPAWYGMNSTPRPVRTHSRIENAVARCAWMYSSAAIADAERIEPNIRALSGSRKGAAPAFRQRSGATPRSWRRPAVATARPGRTDPFGGSA